MKATPNLYAGVHGISTIDHRIRMKLGLSINEYVVLDFLINNEKPIDLDFDVHAWKYIGLTREEIMPIIESVNRIQSIKERWKEEFDFDADFEVFWQNIFQRHGNKTDAQKKYKECRKLVEKKILHSRAIQYIQSRPDFPNYTKAAEVWLNPKKRHWEDILPGDRKAEEKISEPIFPKD